MLQLNGFLHRHLLAVILSRCLSSDYRSPEFVRADLHELKRIVNFNAYCGCLILDAFARLLLGRLHGDFVQSTAVLKKGVLKDLVARQASSSSPGVEETIAEYWRHPGNYYRETPINGRIYTRRDDASCVLGVARVKRFRRIAEKASRYLIDFLFRATEAKSEDPAAEVAGGTASLIKEMSRMSLPFDGPTDECRRAERRVMELIRKEDSLGKFPPLPINDILGFKAVCPRGQEARVIDEISDLDGCAIDEQETRSGQYSAAHLIVSFRWPKDAIFGLGPVGRAREILLERGCSCDIDGEYREFVRSAEDRVTIEVILCSVNDLVESELGHAMHEERVLAQRMSGRYQGSVARNIEYLMEYLFRFCISARSTLDEVPIKLGVKYMPDYIEDLRARLEGASSETDFTEACVCAESALPTSGRENEGV